MTAYSLKVRTRRAFLRPLALAIAVVVLLGAFLTNENVSGLRDDQMRQDARFLLLLASHEAEEGDAVGDIEASDPLSPARGGAEGRQFRVWSARGEITRSAAMPDFGAPGAAGFRDEVADGQRWRVYVLVPETGGIGIELAEAYATRWRIVAGIVLSLAVPLALLSAAVIFIGSRAVKRALLPIERLSSELDQRDGDDFTLVTADALPLEVQPLLVALNRLFDRLGQTLEREREFSDNAAHELRTPLAALKARSQVVERKLRANPELALDLRRFIEAVDRAAGVIDRLLAFSRLSPQDGFAPFDLSSVVEDVAREMAPLALAKAIEIEVAIAPGLGFTGNETGIRHATRNMLENAFKFTPSGGRVTVSLDLVGDEVVIAVADTGPGIGAGEERRIFERFHRGQDPQAGSGLGLALVERVARLHLGQAEATRLAPHGLKVCLRLPRR
ncbi:MAG: ATP-binding protein [Zavarzinia sp.]|nr:ATP-binding protein [Zavarzinia sp.]